MPLLHLLRACVRFRATRAGAVLSVLGILVTPARDAHACCPASRVVDHRWNCLSPPAVGCTLAGPVVDGAGGVYALTNAANGTLVVLASRDDGLAFSVTAIPGSAVRAAGQAAISASNAGDVIVAWTDADDHRLWVSDSHDQARTFQAPVMMASDPAQALGTVAIQATAPGFLLAWQRAASVLAYPQELWSAASSDAGRTWSAPARIDDGGIGLQGAASFVSAGLDIVGSWLQGTPGIVTADHSHDGGLTWSPDIMIARAVLGRPTLLATTGTGAFALLTWQDGASGSLQMSASTDAGRTWSGIELVAPASTSSALVALPDGRVAYTVESTPGSWDTWISVSLDRGLPGSFGPTSLLVAGVRRAEELWLARGAGSQAWLLQGDYRDAAACAVVTTCESVYLSPACKALSLDLPPILQVDQDDPPNLAHSEDGRLAISASGRVHVFWVDLGEAGAVETRHAAFDARNGTAAVDFEMTGPLLVSKPLPGVRLAWPDSRPEATHYDVLEGTIASLHVARAYDHAGNPCGLPRTPPAAPSASLAEAMPAVDTYWLVVATTCAGAGPAGFDSFGRLTPSNGSGTPCDTP